MPRKTKAQLEAELASLGKEERSREKRLYTFSHLVMAGIVTTFFMGVATAIYCVIFRASPLAVLLDFIMRLALPVGLGYFVKAFGENIAKIVLSGKFSNPSAPERATIEEENDA